MAASHSIPSFPPDIDRDYFGAWLSGFTDGEGTFLLGFMTKKDGYKQSYWRAGWLYYDEKPGRKPQMNYLVDGIETIVKVVVPHFERYPLQAKKSRDFVIWKEAAKLVYGVTCRPTIHLGYRYGQMAKWTKEDRDEFLRLAQMLKSIRRFESNGLITGLQPRTERNLFDEFG
jgi:hypothetical protein